MKLCPQCDFIYEDDQRFCDMDGKELVHNSAPVIPASVADLSPASKPATGRRSIGLAFALIVGVVVTALGSAAYFARTEQTGSGAASSNQATEQSVAQSPAQSTSGATGAQPSAADSSATQTSSAANSGLTEQSTEQSVEQSPEQSSAQTDASSPASTPSSSRASLAHTRLTASPVSAGAPGGNSRGPVIVRLNNGASIRADEAWERNEGIWYRQGGVVTFLKRSRVRTIERPGTPSAPSKSATSNAEDKSQKQNTAVRSQPRLARVEPAETKKQSRVASFLKATGRILKRPFKF